MPSGDPIHDPAGLRPSAIRRARNGLLSRPSRAKSRLQCIEKDANPCDRIGSVGANRPDGKSPRLRVGECDLDQVTVLEMVVDVPARMKAEPEAGKDGLT